MQKILTYIAFGVVGLFALVGLTFTGVFIAMQYGLLNVPGSIAERNAFFGQFGAAPNSTTTPPCINVAQTTCNWIDTPEWPVIKGGLQKDQSIIDEVSTKSGVPSRILATVVVPEQVRFFTSEREVFKRYFEPLKILGSLSQFSLGVSGIKQETANAIEKYAADPTSPFYPGPDAAPLIAYAVGANHDAELYNRLTDPKNHYYSYLYTAIYIKEVEAQWHAAGYNLSQNPGALVTLFNIGFQNSHPNPNPQLGGASITTGGKSYTYGELGQAFYDSSELADIFPQQ